MTSVSMAVKVDRALKRLALPDRITQREDWYLYLEPARRAELVEVLDKLAARIKAA